MIDFPRKKYNIIYADPPWNGLGWNNGSGNKAPSKHYEVQDRYVTQGFYDILKNQGRSGTG